MTKITIKKSGLTPQKNSFRSYLGALVLLCVAPVTAAQGEIDQFINDAVQPITSFLSSVVFYTLPLFGADIPLVVVWLVCAAVFFTLYLNVLNVRGFGHAIKLVRGNDSDPKDPGEVSHFQALATAVSGTVGIGNISGVAVAISVGGPGATFWMIIAG
ncbi:MAG: alanine:cation symporter family protein, partial [OM182 bacterium]|nr:alanine:cation symporter family protein [OM182 bacterium]